MSPQTPCCVLAIFGLLIGSAPAMAAFSCSPQIATPGGDKLDLGAMPLSTSSPGLPQTALDAIGRMQANGATSGHIVDALVSADCARVAATGLSDRAKASEIQRFASRVAAFVYSNPASTEEDILIDVPVPHETFNAVAAAAKKENVSQDAWVNAAIQSKLKQE